MQKMPTSTGRGPEGHGPEDPRTLVAVLPNYSGYVDRFAMLCAMAVHFAGVKICVMAPETISQEVPANVEVLTSALTGGKRWAFLKQVARSLSRGKEYAIFETFSLKLYFFIRIFSRLPRKDYQLTLALYEPVLAYFLQGRWRAKGLWSVWPLDGWEEWWVRLKQIVREVISCPLADRVLVNSEEIKRDLVHFLRVSPQKVFVVPTSLACENFPWPLPKQETLPLLLVDTGRLHIHKRPHLILEALAPLRMRQTWRLLYVGDVKTRLARRWFEAQIKRFGLEGLVMIRPRQSRQDLVKIYQEAACAIFPSVHEGSPRVIKEALAMNLPVFATDLPGTRCLDPEGHRIHFFTPDSPQELTQHLNDFLVRPGWYFARAQGQREYSEKNFSSAHVAKIVQALL